MFIYENDRFGRKPAAKAQQKSAGWRGVEVVVTEQCCQAARELAGRRYLTAEAPLFPLRECSQAHCNCRYRHFDDRRTRSRRSDERHGLARRVAEERRAIDSRRTEEASV